MTKEDFYFKISMISYKTGRPYNQILRDEARRIQTAGGDELEELKEGNPFLTDEDIVFLKEHRSNEALDKYVEKIRKAMKESRGSNQQENETRKVKGLEMNTKLINRLTGFAVIREEKTGRIHIYYQDPRKKSLKGKLESSTGMVTATSGFYVNFEEFMEKMISEILASADEPIRLIKYDRTEISFEEAMKEIYEEVRGYGYINFGNEIGKRKVDTLEQLKDLQLKSTESFQGEPLKTGVYIRRDVLISVLERYKIVPKEEKKEGEIHSK